MFAGLLLGLVQRSPARAGKTQVNIAIRCLVGYSLHETLPDHSSLTRIRQRWGKERFRRVFEGRCGPVSTQKIVKGDVVHVDASLIRADVSWEGLAVPHIEAMSKAYDDEEAAARKESQDRQVQEDVRLRSARRDGDQCSQPAPRAGLQAACVVNVCAVRFSTLR